MSARSAPRGDGWDGFTLVEVLVALLVALTGVMGVAALLQRTLDASGRSMDAAAAEALLGDRVESLRALPYADLRNGSDAVVLGGVAFRRSWRVESDEPVPGMKRIEVTVNWSDDEPLLAGDVNELTGGVGDVLADPTAISELPDRLQRILEEGGHQRRAVLFRSGH